LILESEVREQLLDVLQEEVSLGDFADWLALERRNMHQDSSPEAQELVSSLSLLFYEYLSGHMPEEQLRHELASIAGNRIVNVRVVGNLVHPIKQAANWHQVLVPGQVLHA
jgi:hypothetical protein